MTRIFVGNLPTDIVEKDVENEFASYGTVNKVEVKHKRDPLSNDIMSTFAFVTIIITDSLLNQCLEEFKNEKFRGRFLTVSVARESFMEKLKREREESTQRPLETDKLPVNPKPIVVKNPFRPTVQNRTVRTFDSDNVEPNTSVTSTIDPEDCIKRKSKLFTENGKIKIPSFNEVGNAAVQTATKIERKVFDEKSEKADRKRVESLINMKNTYNQQKKTVQEALANLGPATNKKIIFEEPATEIGTKPPKKSQPLFDQDADDDDDFDYAKSFEMKKQYEGESGARLQKLQSRFQNDQRFKMNENFLDENDDANEAEEVVEATDSPSDERKWQYDMLESVMGKKLQSEAKKKSDNLMLRYDPTKNDHEKYEKAAKRKSRNRETDAAPTKQQKLEDDSGAFQVSKEQFFNVTNQLTSALKPTSEGFSLLSMFGRDNDIVDTKPKNPYQEITLSKGQQNILLNSSSAFHDDSSDEDSVIGKTESRSTNEPKQKNAKKNSKAEIWHEPFFIFGSDVRLQDGLSFFLPNSTGGTGAEDFENKQKEMRTIIKRKIKKSIKRVLPRGAKPNKRFGRLVRDVA
ncbi:probable RNA-binding protein CG14230 [Bradysia coprophila]|uniref:probable RNA-binding protein CG14230 n=1 Tax=Bradysia coprophila TaxID=38358 RepID=UPI00187D86DF|nr:probable RNA-binding protein CG14230 [Bradysia coprophila]